MYIYIYTYIHYITLPYITLHYITLQYNTIQYNTYIHYIHIDIYIYIYSSHTSLHLSISHGHVIRGAVGFGHPRRRRRVQQAAQAALLGGRRALVGEEVGHHGASGGTPVESLWVPENGRKTQGKLGKVREKWGTCGENRGKRWKTEEHRAI